VILYHRLNDRSIYQVGLNWPCLIVAVGLGLATHDLSIQPGDQQFEVSLHLLGELFHEHKALFRRSLA
jgi:hypothetical protein